MASITGAILIGGMSSRFGAPKHQFVLPDGRTMLERVQAALRQVCERVVLVDAAHSLEQHSGLVIRDSRVAAGPLGAIEALLASDLDLHYLVCPCDLPFIRADVLELLARGSNSRGSVFHIEGHPTPEPLPACIPIEALPIVRRLLDSQQRSVWKLMDELKPNTVYLDQTMASTLRNINRLREIDGAFSNDVGPTHG